MVTASRNPIIILANDDKLARAYWKTELAKYLLAAGINADIREANCRGSVQAVLGQLLDAGKSPSLIVCDNKMAESKDGETIAAWLHAGALVSDQMTRFPTGKALPVAIVSAAHEHFGQVDEHTQFFTTAAIHNLNQTECSGISAREMCGRFKTFIGQALDIAAARQPQGRTA
jgi:hypothetical protein